MLKFLFSSHFTVWVVAIIQFVISVELFVSQQTEGLFLNLFLFWLFVFLYSIYNRPNGVILMAFLISFFVFLLGRDFFVMFFDFDISKTYPFPRDCIAHIYFSMHLSLFGILFGFLLLSKVADKRPLMIGADGNNIKLYKKIVLHLFYLTLIFSIIDVAINIFYFIVLGTRTLHTIYILQKLTQINFLMFCGYLMLMPSKRELMPLLKLVLIIKAFTFLTGNRGDFLYFSVFVFCYLLFRDYYSKKIGLDDEVFITKKIKYLLVFILPFFLIFLGLFASMRLGVEAETSGFTNDFAAFFIQQGGSSSVIGYTKYYESSFPSTNISYTFGPLINFIKYGIFGRLMGNHMPGWEEAPMYANNLGATITWVVSPEYYYAGGGFGNQYIAELYKDFGYWGVALFSIILGIVFRKFIFFSTKSWVLNVLFIITIQKFISMPRDFYLTWLTGIISPLNIFVLLYIKCYVTNRIRKLQQV